MWNGSWNEETNTRNVAGIQGWWRGKVGFEKSPEYFLYAGTGLFDFVPGQEYHIQVGSIDGHMFVFADGRLLLELKDPQPIDNKVYGRIGFDAYCSQIRFRDFKVRQIAWKPVAEHYTAEF